MCELGASRHCVRVCCRGNGRSSVDDAVIKAVSTQLTDTLAWLLPGPRRISDEYVSSDESFNGDQAPEWLLEVEENAY